MYYTNALTCIVIEMCLRVSACIMFSGVSIYCTIPVFTKGLPASLKDIFQICTATCRCYCENTIKYYNTVLTTLLHVLYSDLSVLLHILPFMWCTCNIMDRRSEFSTAVSGMTDNKECMLSVAILQFCNTATIHYRT